MVQFSMMPKGVEQFARKVSTLRTFLFIIHCSLFIICFFVLGCGGKRELKPVEVEGVVRFEDNRPVPEMLLNFLPQETTNQNNRPSELVKKDARFKFTCLPGKYKVTVFPIPKQGSGPDANVSPAPGSPDAGKVFSGDAEYRDERTTPWIIEVPLEGKTDFVLTVKKK